MGWMPVPLPSGMSDCAGADALEAMARSAAPGIRSTIPAGQDEKCSGAQMLAAIRRLSPNKEVERKLLFGNAKRVLRLAV